MQQRQSEIRAGIEASKNEPCENPKDRMTRENLASVDRLYKEDGHTLACAGRQVYQEGPCTCHGEPEKVEAPHVHEPLSDKGKAFFLSLALACVAEIQAEEDGVTQASRVRRKKARALMGDVVKFTRLYSPDGFEYEDMRMAEDVWDETNEKVRSLYP